MKAGESMSDQDRCEQPEVAVQNPRYEGATPERVAMALLRAKTDETKEAPNDAVEKQASEG